MKKIIHEKDDNIRTNEIKHDRIKKQIIHSNILTNAIKQSNNSQIDINTTLKLIMSMY